jgi:hypothetical protein
MVCENAAMRMRGEMRNRHYGRFARFENAETRAAAVAPPPPV